MKTRLLTLLALALLMAGTGTAAAAPGGVGGDCSGDELLALCTPCPGNWYLVVVGHREYLASCW